MNIRYPLYEGVYRILTLYSLLLLVVCDWWIWGLSVPVGYVLK